MIGTHVNEFAGDHGFTGLNCHPTTPPTGENAPIRLLR